MARFETRKWSDKDARSFDVVFIDDDNHVYYQPGVSFSTEAGADKHQVSLSKMANHDSVRHIWIRETQN